MKKILITIAYTLTIQLVYCDTYQHMQEIFTKTYESNWWGDNESVSGTGSNLKQTELIRLNLPSLLKLLQVKTFLDAACGDFYWMKEIDLSFLDMYIGVDIVPNLIKRNRERYMHNNRSFKLLNIAFDPLPKADLIFCRDCLVHLEFADCIKVLKNFKKSGAKYLLISTFTRNQPNAELSETGWRTLNMQKPPFNFPQPFMMLNEDCSEGEGAYHDKSLGLWRLDDINL